MFWCALTSSIFENAFLGLRVIKRLREIRRLLVFDNNEEWKDDRIIRLIQCQSSTKGYSYRLMRMQDFISLKRDYRLDFPVDFGVYGNKYVYRGHSNIVDNIVGDFYNNKVIIVEYTRFFEGCWNSHFAYLVKSVIKDNNISLENLFSDASENTEI